MIIHKVSDKSYPFMVAYHQILEYSIIMYQIIYFFEVEASSLLNSVKLLLLKWLICGND